MIVSIDNVTKIPTNTPTIKLTEMANKITRTRTDSKKKKKKSDKITKRSNKETKYRSTNQSTTEPTKALTIRS